jgi:hypothetical protein
MCNWVRSHGKQRLETFSFGHWQFVPDQEHEGVIPSEKAFIDGTVLRFPHTELADRGFDPTKRGERLCLTANSEAWNGTIHAAVRLVRSCQGRRSLFARFWTALVPDIHLHQALRADERRLWRLTVFASRIAVNRDLQTLTRSEVKAHWRPADQPIEPFEQALL